MYDTDVFIVGGGPAGLAAALAARRKGLRVMVADAARVPVDKACGEGLMPDGIGALRELGVIVDPANAFPFRGIRFIESGVSFGADFPTGRGLGVRRTVLHATLAAHAQAAGVLLFWQTPVSVVSGEEVAIHNRTVRARWIIGADGVNSRVRRWAGLDGHGPGFHRFGFRRHYRVAPWTDFMEIYWGTGAQVYVTPVSSDSVCVALISRDRHRRFEQALPQFPEIAGKLKGAPVATSERGAITASRKFASIHRGNVALIGDASGSVDAITGEGLCLAFQQALLLANALERADLRAYGEAHARLRRRPAFMASLMLSFDQRPRLRMRTFRALASDPGIFRSMLAMHVGALSAPAFAASTVTLAWQMLSA